MSSYKEITYTVSQGVATVKINRPKTLNSLTAEVYGEMSHALLNAAENPVRCFGRDDSSSSR